jgi:hypothetical protein
MAADIQFIKGRGGLQGACVFVFFFQTFRIFVLKCVGSKASPKREGVQVTCWVSVGVSVFFILLASS